MGVGGVNTLMQCWPFCFHMLRESTWVPSTIKTKDSKDHKDEDWAKLP